MEQLADGVHRIALLPRDAINAYVIGDVLVDAGIKQSGAKLVAALRGREIAAHALTHAHPDHVGGSRHVVDALGVPLWAPEGDAAEVEAGRPRPVPGRVGALLARAGAFAAVPVARRLREGDDAGAGFTVLDVPGHSPGHVAFWREADRVLVAGDVFFNLNLLTLRPGLSPPAKTLTFDPLQNGRSMRRLADLEPSLALFGHGPPVRDAAAKLRAVAAKVETA
jgi:glyoxylase-like metal-dependent hydrolase (beta-lactamase superfamily II)